MKKIFFIFLFFLTQIGFGQDQLKKAQKAIEQKNWQQARQEANQLLENMDEINQEYVEAKWILAKSYRQEDLAQSLRYYLEVLDGAEKVGFSMHQLGDILVDIGLVYKEGQVFEQALEYFSKARFLVDETKQVVIIGYIAESYAQNQDYDNAISYYENLVKYYEKQKDAPKQIWVMQQIVGCYSKKNNYEEAAKYDFQILELLQKTSQDSSKIAVAYNNLGYDYKFLERYEDALRLFRAALLTKKKIGQKDDEYVASLINLGVIYQNKQNYDQAIAHLREASLVLAQKGDSVRYASIIDLISVLYQNKKDFYNAYSYNEEALRIAEKYADKNLQMNVYLNAANIYQQLENFEKALEYTRKHLAIKNELLNQQEQQKKELLEQQYLVDKIEKQWKIEASEKQRMLAESKKNEILAQKNAQEVELLRQREKNRKSELDNIELEKSRTQQALQLAQQQILADQREKSIAILEKHQAELEKQKIEKDFELQAKKAETERKKRQIAQLEQSQKLQNAQLSEQETRRQALMGVVGLAFLIILLGIYSYLQQQKANKRLANQNQRIQSQKDEIETRGIELMMQTEEIQSQRDALKQTNAKLNKAYDDVRSSVQYAQRIQQAMLPTLPSIQAALPQSFVLFKPRDIVSGDFYWFGETRQKHIIAAVDCTGHGVPGAFMSLIGNDLLNEIVTVRQIDIADLILNELDKGVRKALKQDQNQGRDGMDLALCVIDKEENFLDFAGAKNPLIYIHNQEVITIRGSRMPIGGKQDDGETRLFEMHHIDFEAQDTFYLCSDGYQDQFGGSQNRKFMSKNMKELFLKIHHEDMDFQKNTLDQTIEKWRGEEEQIDDILVIGFRVPPRK